MCGPCERDVGGFGGCLVGEGGVDCWGVDVGCGMGERGGGGRIVS